MHHSLCSVGYLQQHNQGRITNTDIPLRLQSLLVLWPLGERVWVLQWAFLWVPSIIKAHLDPLFSSGHAVELPFVFHTLNMANFTPTAAEMDLATNMTRYWTNFAKTGNPNDYFTNMRNWKSRGSHTLHKAGVQRLPDWPPFYASDDTGTKNAGCMRFKTPQSEVSGVVFLSATPKMWWTHVAM